ncbi:MAG: hypothetical protein H7Y30_07730 [Pyrinomonadaceae bacterium]|nr:hypothetical protein [Pyrinomonadaceae bacterium]
MPQDFGFGAGFLVITRALAVARLKVIFLNARLLIRAGAAGQTKDA